MKINNITTNITFKSNKQDVHKADDIQRLVRKNFPAVSATHIESDFLTAKKRKVRNIVNSLNQTIQYNREKIGIRDSEIDLLKIYSKNLDSVKENKLANCLEYAFLATAAMLANGYDAQRVDLFYGPEIYDKNNKFINTKDERNLDHTFIITTLNDKEREAKNKYIVIDSWLGFADTIDGANKRFSQLYGDDLKEIKRHRSFFSKLKYRKNEPKWNFLYKQCEELDEETQKALIEKVKKDYPQLILKG